jgi:hypothetical protein
MIQQLDNMPDNMIGFRAQGEVVKDDFTHTVIPCVEQHVEKTGKLNYLLLLDTSVKDFSAGAWWQDALMGIKNITKWNRAAIVSDSEGIRRFTDFFSKLMPGEFKGFHKEDLDKAILWTSEQTEEPGIDY